MKKNLALIFLALGLMLTGCNKGDKKTTTATSNEKLQTTGTAGSPFATTTIEGKQLPNPPFPFEGKIEETVDNSKSYWPPQIVPPKGAPNVLLIMTDDQGYGISGTFGGVIPTPAMDQIGKNRNTLYRVSFNRFMFTFPRSINNRTKSPFCWLWCNNRAIHRISRI